MDVNSLSSPANDCQKVPQSVIFGFFGWPSIVILVMIRIQSNSILFYLVNWLYISKKTKQNTKYVPYLEQRCTVSHLVQWNFCPERNMHPRNIIRPATIYSIHSLTAATLATSTTIIRPVLTKYSNKETYFLPNIFYLKINCSEIGIPTINE